jgi:hypothetical protein
MSVFGLCGDSEGERLGAREGRENTNSDEGRAYIYRLDRNG